MDSLLFISMLILILFIGFKNIGLIKRYRQNNAYIEAYKGVLSNTEDCHDTISNYIEKEKSNEFKNKARIIKLFCELNNDIEYENTLTDLDFKEIYFRKNEVDPNKVKMNSDSFIFAMLAIFKAYEKKDMYFIEALLAKLEEVNVLLRRVEYSETVCIGLILGNKGDDLTFLKALLEGNYTAYQYDKRMIGLYKRMASSMLAFLKQDFDEFFRNDLHSFSKTTIGEIVLKSLGIYETYKPIETSVEDKPEEVQENKE